MAGIEKKSTMDLINIRLCFSTLHYSYRLLLGTAFTARWLVIIMESALCISDCV